MYKTIFQIDGSKQQDVVGGLKKAGFRLASMNKPIPTGELRDVLTTVDGRTRRMLGTGAASFIPKGRAEFLNGDDSVTVNDFDIAENQTLRNDPVVIVVERIRGRTSRVVQEILEETVTVEIIKSALISVTSRKFKTSVMDLARVTREDPNVVYNRCINTLVRSCVAGFKRIDVTATELLPTKMRQRIPVAAV